MIAHRLSTVMNCDMIIALRNGQIIEKGTHSELLQVTGGYYRSLWERQSKVASKEMELIKE